MGSFRLDALERRVERMEQLLMIGLGGIDHEPDLALDENDAFALDQELRIGLDRAASSSVTIGPAPRAPR